MKFKNLFDGLVKDILEDPDSSAMFREFIDRFKDPVRLLGIQIDGVEVTQSIQYFHADEHLTSAADRGPDNSITLVVDKPAMVRVYVSSRITPVNNVTAEVTVQRRRYGVWVDAEKLTQQFPGSINADTSPDYATRRRSLWNTLNFIIPAANMRGRMRLKVKITSGGSDPLIAEKTIEISAFLKQTLRVRGIPVQYWGPDNAGNQVKLSAPTLADFQTTSATAAQMFPVCTQPDITLAGTFTWSNPLTGNMKDGNCPKSWDDLLFWLSIAKAIDGNKTDRTYYALLPNNIPVGNTGGCGGGGAVGAGFINRGMSMAHEIGHVFNFSHAPGCLPADDKKFDTNYPAYEPYDSESSKMASIGEYGIDTSDNWVYDPASARDFMSYCPTRWISLYHYKALIENPILDPQIVSSSTDELPPWVEEQYIDPLRVPDPTPPWLGRRLFEKMDLPQVSVIVISGFTQFDRIDVQSVMRLKTRLWSQGRAVKDTLVELLNANNEVVDRQQLYNLETQPCGCGCGGHGKAAADTIGIIQAILPDRDDIAAIRITRSQEEIWSRRAPAGRPEIRDFNVEVHGEELFLSWVTITNQNTIERFVRYSTDNGAEWHMLALNLSEDRLQAPVSNLPPGNLVLQVSVSDGFHTVTAQTTVDIPRASGSVAIMWPTQGCVVKSDTALHCWGMASDPNGQAIPGRSLRWELNGQAIGEGTELWAALPPWESEHCLKLVAGDGDREISTSVNFLATASGKRPYRKSDC
ncbi:hypothetical protein [Flavihumibacter solisilvae]|nr:hypothetical protein [Flavihumibacter solisilvae]